MRWVRGKIAQFVYWLAAPVLDAEIERRVAIELIVVQVELRLVSRLAQSAGDLAIKTASTVNSKAAEAAADLIAQLIGAAPGNSPAEPVAEPALPSKAKLH